MNSSPYMRRQFLVGTLYALGLSALAGADTVRQGATAAPPGLFNVRDFGAIGDGTTLDTTAIQAAIDRAFADGGGIVYFPPGRFLSGTITVRSGVTVHLSTRAVLLGSGNAADYPAQDFPARDLDVGGYTIWALLYAKDAEQIAIEGDGVIDGNGRYFPKVDVRDPNVPSSVRPRMIFFKNCRTVTLRDVTLRESGIWTVHLALCDTVRISGLHVSSTVDLNQDGIVLDSCHDATVRDCAVRTVDDGIVLKSSLPRACSDITISNCDVQSYCAAIKLGTQSLGGFRDVTITDCVLHDCRLGGVKLQAVDGGVLENVTVQNINMNNVAAPLSVRRGNRGYDFGFTEVQHPRPVGTVRNVLIRRVRAVLSTDAALRDGLTMSIAGIPGHPVEDVAMEDLTITFPGGGTLEDARRVDIPERESAYPEHTMFGILPAHGLYVRHAARVALRDVRFELATTDARPAVICDDVDGFELTGFDGVTSATEPLIRLRDTRDAVLSGCRPLGDITTFLSAEGTRSTDIAVRGNDLRHARVPLAEADGFAGRITAADNL